MTHALPDNCLRLWLPVDMDGSWAYYLSEQISGIAETASEKSALSGLDARHLWVICPGQWARILPIDLPKMRQADRLAAAGFAIEEQIGGGLSEQHITLSSTGRERAAVIARTKMKSLCQSLSNHGLAPDQILVDFDAIKPAGRRIDLDDRIIITGDHGFASDPQIYPSLPTANIAGLSPESWAFDALNQQIDAQSAVNLLQGEFAPSRFDASVFKPLSRLAAMAAVLAICGLVWTGASTRAAKMGAKNMQTQTRALYEQAMGERAPANPALVVTRAQRSVDNPEANFLSLSSVLFEALKTTPDIVVESLQYDSAQNRLNVRLIYPSFEAASDVEAVIARQGGQFQTGGVREQGERLIGDAVLRLGQSG